MDAKHKARSQELFMPLRLDKQQTGPQEPKKNVRQQWEENQKLLEEAKKRLQNKLPAEVLALQQNA